MTTSAGTLQLPAYFEAQEALNKYIEGIRTGNVELLRSVFDANARLHGSIMGTLVNGPLDVFLKDVSERPPPAKSGEPFRAAIVELHVNGNVARGTVIEQGYFGLNFMDYFHLLKTERGWVIVDKTFYHEPPKP
ncbi:MAG: nuclear transport factor 2 family protein [Gammaproteobacteria bacterium]|nr:nuclear transport factor 2 family protein [Gammaproteobacteria bacterium]